MIIQAPNPILNKVAEPLEHDTSTIEIYREMKQALRGANGVGLAAPQVGISKRVIWICTKAYTGFIVNPKITKFSGNMKKSKEGCLSLKGHKHVTVQRDRDILVIGFDLNWNPVGFRAKNFSAFVVQHEIDHLDGITLVERLKK